MKIHEKTTQFTNKDLKKVNICKIQQLQKFQPSSLMYLGCSIHTRSIECPLAFQTNSKGILTIMLLSTDCQPSLSINQPIQKVQSSLDIKFETRKFSTCQLYFINCDCHRTKLLYILRHSTCEKRAFTEHSATKIRSPDKKEYTFVHYITYSKVHGHSVDNF